MTGREQQEAAARWARSVLDKDATDVPERTGAESWQAAWAALELPPVAAAPVGFARRAAAAWAAEQAAAAAPILGATWMRAAAAAALLAGIALGSTLAYSSGGETSAYGADSWQSTSLSEEYLSALSTPDAILMPPAGADDSPGVAADESLADEP